VPRSKRKIKGKQNDEVVATNAMLCRSLPLLQLPVTDCSQAPPFPTEPGSIISSN